MPATAHNERATRPVIVLGCGGHALVVIDALRASGAAILGAMDKDATRAGESVADVRILGGDASMREHDPSTVLLANGLGSTSDAGPRRALFERFRQAGYSFVTVVHPSAVLAADVELAEGVQVMAGAVIQPRCRIGANCVINTRAGIDHDALIGDHVHVAPGATVCGEVTVGDGCHVGAGATVIQRVKLAPGCIVAAGAVVVSSFDGPGLISGVPAKLRITRG